MQERVAHMLLKREPAYMFSPFDGVERIMSDVLL